jgi:hypothetical protein
MADDIISTGDPQQQSVQLVVDEKDLKSDLGFNLPDPNPQGGNPRLLFKVTDRVIMSYASTKRLSQSINQLVNRYEQQFGPIQVRPSVRQQ